MTIPQAIAPVSKAGYSHYFLDKSRSLFRGQAPDWAYELQLMVDSIRKYGDGGTEVLELGCGVGVVLFFLSREGFDCTGVDFDATQIESAHSLAHELEIENVDFICSRTENMDLGDKRFHVVVSRDVAEHLPDDDLLRYLKQAFRFLKPGGILVLHTKPTKYAYLHEREFVWLVLPLAVFGPRVLRAWLKVLDAVVPRMYRAVRRRPMPNTWQQRPPGHCNCPEKAALARTAERAGFSILATTLFVPANRRYFQLLKRILPFETTMYNILLVARKPAPGPV